MDKNEINMTIIDETDKVSLTEFNGRSFILMPLQETDDVKFNEYKKFKIQKIVIKGKEKTCVEFYDTEFRDDIFSIVSSRIEEGENIFNILDALNDLLLKDKKNYLKLRGDVGELLFIMENGGVKTKDEESFDIIWNDKYVEVKTFSPAKKTIEISDKQLRDNTLKYATAISQDSNGLTILEMANKIEKTNQELYNYLKETYKKDTYLASLKFKILKPFDITEQTIGEFTFPNNVVSVKYSIFIDVPEDHK